MYPPSPLIAFITDFGLKDPYAGIVKGVIAGINPSVRVIDITHEIPPQDITTAALMLKTAFGYFPPGTIFLAVVDPGVGSDRRAIILTLDHYTFVGPDNGLLTGVLEHGEHRKTACWYIEDKEYFLKQISSTFHARDIFGPVAAHLSLGVKPDEFGPACSAPVMPDWPQPVSEPGLVRGIVIYVDTFGNLVTNIPADALHGKNYESSVRYAYVKDSGIAIPVAITYADVEPGQPLCVEGSFGLVEIAVNQGNAAEMFNANRGDTVELKSALVDTLSGT